MAKTDLKTKSNARSKQANKSPVAGKSSAAKSSKAIESHKVIASAKGAINGKDKPKVKTHPEKKLPAKVSLNGRQNNLKSHKTEPDIVAKKPARIIPRVQMTADVLVMGEHPAAYLCAALLHDVAKVKVIHSAIPGEVVVDRLCHLNPEFFSLSKLLEPLRRKLEMDTIYGVQFLGADAATRSEYRSKSIAGYIVSYKAFRNAVVDLAKDVGVQFISPDELEIQRLDESGVDLSMGKIQMRTKMMITAGMPSVPQQKMLGMPENWGVDVVRRFSILKIKGTKSIDLGARPIMPMSLNVAGQFLRKRIF